MAIASINNPGLQALLQYISTGWDGLTRSSSEPEALADPKLVQATVHYVPADRGIPDSLHELSEKQQFRTESLPFVISGPGQISRDRQLIEPPGLLFLEHPYIVPGGRFNEMYGWDSYFIIRGLLREGKLDLAHGMVENFFFEIEHYGAVLNANRSYYLTRSQPPFLTSMIRAVYEAQQARGTADPAWLERAYHYADRDYEMWMHTPHLAGSTGLSRFFDFGEGPVPEGLHDEIDYYHQVLTYFLEQERPCPYVTESDTPQSLLHKKYSRQLRDKSPAAEHQVQVRHVGLSPEFYKGDRSMRESGFDISFRFGPFGAETHHFAPVCLNSLLYKTEKDLEAISGWLGHAPAETMWHERSEKRKKIMRALLWNPHRGMFFDFNFKTQKQSTYEYASTFYPLWAGLATAEEAEAVAKNLRVFECSGGVAMSTQETGLQWDYPYGWAPIQLLAVEGLRRYGYTQDADRISRKFLTMVLANFERDHNLREKYNVVTDSSNVHVAEGYRDNVIGFGWTNAVFLELLDQLPIEQQESIGKSPSLKS
jgi:alpha,alpha-trehalase